MHTSGSIMDIDYASTPIFDDIEVTEQTFEKEVIAGLWYYTTYHIVEGVTSVIFRYYRPEGTIIDRKDILIAYNGGYQDYQFAVGTYDTYPTDETKWYDAPPALADGEYLWMRTKWTGSKD